MLEKEFGDEAYDDFKKFMELDKKEPAEKSTDDPSIKES